MTKQYQDKFWVVEEIRGRLANDTYLLERFNWLLEVWNTRRDYAYPSLEEYDHRQRMTEEENSES